MPSPPSVPAELLAGLAGALARSGAAWYVFGAQAVVIWGRPRLTADIDVTVRLDPEEPERLVRALEDAGFALRFGAAEPFVRRTRVLPFVHTASGLPLDVVLAGPGLEERFLSRAVPVTIGHCSCPRHQPGGPDRDEDPGRPGRRTSRMSGAFSASATPASISRRFCATPVLLEEALGQSDLRPLC